MAYIESQPNYGTTVTAQQSSSVTYPQSPATIRAQPQSPDALSNLGKASQEYAAAADKFIAAREDLNDARARWQECRDVVAKVSEAEGI